MENEENEAPVTDHSETIIEAINKLSTIGTSKESKKIRMVGSNLTVSEADRIWKALIQHPSLRSLEICMCSLSERSLLDFYKILPDSCLILIQFVKVGMSNDSAILLVESALQYANKKRQDLFHPASFQYIRKLDLTFNSIGDEAMPAFAKLISNTLIEILLLGRNMIKNEGCISLAEGIRHGNPCFVSLDLRMNFIGDLGIEKLASALPFSHLKKLELGSNRFTHKSVLALCEVLPFSFIESLDLSDNNLSDDSILALVSILRQTKIAHLFLIANTFGDVGGMALANEIKDNLFMETIKMKATLITTKTMDAMYRSIYTHRSMKTCQVIEMEIGVPEVAFDINMRLHTLHSLESNVFVAICSTKLPGKSNKSIFKRMTIDLIHLILKMLMK